MTRSELREYSFKLLFGSQFWDKEESTEQVEMFFELRPNIEEKEKEYIAGRYHAITAMVTEIDDILNEKTTGWKTNRMNKVDLTILRLAYYEVKCDEDIPTGVAINEAVELAKKYSSNEGPAFVNGVLAKLVD